MGKYAKSDEWKLKNTMIFSVRLQNSTDADIIEYLSKFPSRQGEIKRLIRQAISDNNKA